MRRYLLILSVLSASVFAHAQYRPYYSWAFGFRAGATGGTSGVTIKGFFNNSIALEGIVGYWHGAPAGTLLLEAYMPVSRADGLQLYVGGGAHFTGQTGYGRWYIIERRGYDYLDAGAGYGIDAILGLEYKIPAAPVAFSVDIKPFAEFSEAGGFAMAIDPGLGIKIAF